MALVVGRTEGPEAMEAAAPHPAPPAAAEEEVLGGGKLAGKCGRCIPIGKCGRATVLLATVLIVGLVGLQVIESWWRLPECKEGEDPDHGGCVPKVEAVDWTDPSFALVSPNATLVELRWFKGKLMHPLGRVFGGHHSALVGRFSTGEQVRIEKYGGGSVQYCPTHTSRRCNFAPGDLYKSVSGNFVKKNFTWKALHAAIIEDFDHYDVVDANCHHVVQHAWNAALVPVAQDRNPAPDTFVATKWENFLRRWVSRGDTEAQHQVVERQRKLEEEQRRHNATVMARALQGSYMDGGVQVDLGRGDPGDNFFTTHGEVITSFDAFAIRRRRRRQAVAQRCRGSSLEEEDNCPHRQSSFFDQSSSSGGPSCITEFEFLKKSRVRMFSLFSIWYDKDFTGFKSRGQSDSFFGRMLSSGAEADISGSIHYRYQSSRPSSQSDSMETSSEEMMPMDPARVQGNSKTGPDETSVFASECSHSQAQRSKGDNSAVCQTGLEGLTASSGTYLCQWTCDDGTATYRSSSTSTYVCKGEENIEIILTPGQKEADCLSECNSKNCEKSCTDGCKYLTAAALDAQQAMCVGGSGEDSSSGYMLIQMTKRGLEPGVIVGIVIFVLCQCCCQVGVGASKKSE